MDVLTKGEYYNILALKEHYCKKNQLNVNDVILNRYRQIGLRQRLELIHALNDNIFDKAYEGEEDIRNATAIISHLLLSITDKDLENCLIINDGEVLNINEDKSLENTSATEDPEM